MIQPFQHEAAKAYVDSWITTVDDATLNWAWDVVCGVLDVYTEYGEASEEEVWYDWFTVVVEDEEHPALIGVHGATEEFTHACPEEHQADQVRVLAEAYRIGRGLAPYTVEDDRANVIKIRPEKVSKPPPKLTLVVDNTHRKTT